MDIPIASPPGNIPEYTVSEISGAVKRTLETAFGRVRVRGEITDLSAPRSGHRYLSLKDEGGKLKAVIWRSAANRIGLAPEDGMEVIATGRITTYGDQSTYQLIIERLEYAGIGALLARIEALKQKFAAEGLFDPARKRALPRLPTVIGVVTSAQGAVLHDIRTTILRRFPRPLLIWPVPVQGEGAAERIAAAIAGFDRIAPGGPIPRPDVLIVARGGGSLEDLMAFNEEVVVRAAADCRIPLISAVGHETDTTLIDFAADRRAPTPTAAAEMAVPERIELRADLSQKAGRIDKAIDRRIKDFRHRIRDAAQRLPDLPSLLGSTRQRLDDRAERLRLALPNLVVARRGQLIAVSRHLPSPAALFAHRREPVVVARASLRAALRHAMQRLRGRGESWGARLSPAPLLSATRLQRSRLDGLIARLESISPNAVLGRGYALVFDPSGHPVTTAASVTSGARLRLQFADGDVRATADTKTKGGGRQAKLI